ncbi:MAG: AAA family ATPase [bacterium]|nr:AAA family ATPase [bacterium]
MSEPTPNYVEQFDAFPQSAKDAIVNRALDMGIGSMEPAHGIEVLHNLGDVRQHCKAISWAWPHWIGNGLPTLIVAAPGIGKSTLALCLAHCVYAGTPWPDGTPNTTTQGQTLWIETEAGHRMHVDRAERFCIPDEAVVFAARFDETVSFTDKEFCERVMTYALHDTIRMIVIDSLSGWSSGDENSTTAGDPMKFTGLLSQRSGKPTLVVHHLSKVGWSSDVDNPPTLANVRGAGAIVQHSRIVVVIDAPFKDEPDLLRLTVIKNNYGSERPSIGVRLQSNRLEAFDLRSAIREASQYNADNPSQSAKAKRATRDARIRELYQQGVTQQAISDEMDVSIGTVNRIVNAPNFNLQHSPTPSPLEKLKIESDAMAEATPGAIDFYSEPLRIPGLNDTPNPFDVVDTFDTQRRQYSNQGVN